MLRWLVVIFAFILASCGGGGGGGNGGGSASGTDFTVSGAPVSFSAQQYSSLRGSDAQSKIINVSWTNSAIAAVGVAYASGQTEVDWLSVSTESSSASSARFQFQLVRSDMAVGSHSTSLTVGAADASGNVIRSQVVRVTVTISERPMIGVDNTGPIQFYNVVGKGGNDVTIGLTGDAVEWTFDGNSDILANPSSGVAPQSVTLSPQSSAVAQDGRSGELIFRDRIVTARTTKISYNLNTHNAIELNNGDNIAVSMSESEKDTTPRSFNVTGEGVQWTATVNQPWVTLSKSTGNAPDKVEFLIDTTGLSVGTYTAEILVKDDDVNYDNEARIEINLAVNPRYMFINRKGVAFADMPGLQNLSASLKVEDSSGLMLEWTASSSAPWLTVTPRGTTPTQLNLTADVSGLAKNMFYEAEVTLQAPELSAEEQMSTVKVGLWVGDALPDASIRIAGPFTHLAVDPVRPYVYLTDNSSVISVYHVYNGERVRQITNWGAAGGALEVSEDGSTLFVHDSTNLEIVEINLSDDSLVRKFGQDIGGALHFASIENDSFLVAGTGKVFSLDDVAEPVELFSDGYYGVVNVDISENGKMFCTLNSGISPYTAMCYDIFYSPAAKEFTLAQKSQSVHGQGSNGRDIALNADGTIAYIASGAPYDFPAYETAEFRRVRVLPGNPYPNSIEVGADGRVYAGADSSYADGYFIYEQNGAKVASAPLPNLVARSLLPSGDFLRLVAITSRHTGVAGQPREIHLNLITP